MINLENIKGKIENCNPIILSPIHYDQNIFRLAKDVKIELSDGSQWLIKKGFEYDGATVPYIFQWAFPKFGIYAYNSFVHDLIYFINYKSRAFADKEHFIWGKAIGVKKLDNRIRYVFLRGFGWVFWNRGLKNPSQRALKNRTLIIRIK